MKKIMVFLVVGLMIIPACGQTEISYTRAYCELEALKYIRNMLVHCNEFKNGKSVLTLGEQEYYLKLADMASKIYKRIKSPLAKGTPVEETKEVEANKNEVKK